MKHIGKLVIIVLYILTCFGLFSACNKDDVEATQYTVTFNGNGGTYISGELTQTVEYGKAAVAPFFDKTGLTLSWDNDFSCIKSNITVNAVWNAKVEFISNGGNEVEAYSVVPGGHIIMPQCVRAGYSLDGWYTSMTDGMISDEKWFFAGHVVGSNIKLYAKWEAHFNVTVEGENCTITDLTDFGKTLKTINIPLQIDGKTVISIGDFAFYDCSGFTSIIIPDSVTSIGNSAFYNCSGFNSIVIPDSVTSISYNAFYNCSGLTSITIPDSVTSIVGAAFYNCSGLNSIVIPDSVTSIGLSAFYNCSGLTSITIPDSVISIESSAFYNCSGLNSIVIPDSVTSIGDNAFYNTAWYNNQSSGLVYASKVIYKYKGSIPNGTTITLLPDTKGIADNAFYNCSELISIIIPDSVITIGNFAFFDCSGLTSITIPDSVTSIGIAAFHNCSGLTSIVIPDSVRSIYNSVFSRCNGLTSVTIPDSVTSIGSSAFSRCSGLTSITIPNSVTWIGYEAFYECSYLTIYTEVYGQLVDFGRGWKFSKNWDLNWNFSNRPVVWGCELSDDKTYVVSYTKSTISYLTASKIISAPYREGYNFVGWNTASDGSGTTYTAGQLDSVPYDVRVYAIWAMID